MTRPRIVLDTNVVVSALLFGSGVKSWFRCAWTRGDFVPLASRDTVLEIIRVLEYPKFALTREERDDLLNDYLPFCETVDVHSGKRKLPPCPDPHDVMFLDLALASNADSLVTGDRGLLSVRGFRVPIVTPAEFRERLEQKR